MPKGQRHAPHAPSDHAHGTCGIFLQSSNRMAQIGLAGALAERLQQDIDRLATEHAAPSFQPHVTLLGGTEQTEEDALRIAADLAHAVPVSILSSYYRLEINPQPARRIMTNRELTGKRRMAAGVQDRV